MRRSPVDEAVYEGREDVLRPHADLDDTADAVALEARKAAQAETEPAPAAERLVSGKPSATVTSLHEWRLAHLPPGNRPLPSVTHYDQLLRRRRTSGNHREGEAQRPPCPANEA
ncbi:hypothetical protein [Streptomyces sp. NPDC006510]|uniref:hypothetical protein n=1 Tax=Streptomyces sp. NPDC006510 TaxID=3155600 RepID=UPI0033BF2EB8